MKRQGIMADCPEEFEDKLKDIVDYFEGVFQGLERKLDICNVYDLNCIAEAKDDIDGYLNDLY